MKSKKKPRKDKLSELAAMYGMDKRTLARWLKPFEKEIGPRLGYSYTPKQLQIIFKRLGKPDQ